MRVCLAVIAVIAVIAVMGLVWSGSAAAQAPATEPAAPPIGSPRSAPSAPASPEPAAPAAPASAAPEPAAPAPPSPSAALERGVTERLAGAGVVLSRRGLALQIEAAGDAWLVSLADLTTGRIAASTKVVALPTDDDEAIGALAQVVADLAVQVPAREPPPAAAPAAPARQAPSEAAGAGGLGTASDADLLLRRRMIRFYTYPELGGYSHWVIQRGELDQVLDPAAFYRLVGRDDLARAYTRRHATMVGSFLLAATTFAIAGVLYEFLDDPTLCDTQPTVDGRSGCTAIRHPSFAPVWTMAGLGAAELVLAGYLAYRPQPIDDAEARSLADAYNQQLRRRIGISAAPRSSAPPHVAVVPYVGSGTGGLVLAARF